MQERWDALEAEAAAARQEAEEARAAAGKADADLAALSTAYNDLEEHAFKLEEQLKQQEVVQQQQQQGPAAAPAAAADGVSDTEVQARIQAALEQVGGLWLAPKDLWCAEVLNTNVQRRRRPRQSAWLQHGLVTSQLRCLHGLLLCKYECCAGLSCCAGPSAAAAGAARSRCQGQPGGW
jgi:hypothetical protein